MVEQLDLNSSDINKQGSRVRYEPEESKADQFKRIIFEYVFVALVAIIVMTSLYSIVFEQGNKLESFGYSALQIIFGGFVGFFIGKKS